MARKLAILETEVEYLEWLKPQNILSETKLIFTLFCMYNEVLHSECRNMKGCKPNIEIRTTGITGNRLKIISFVQTCCQMAYLIRKILK